MLHASHLSQARNALSVAAMLVLGFILVNFINTYTDSFSIRYDFFLTLHTIIETVSVIIAALIFTVVLSTYRQGLPASIVILAILSLGMALLDFGHMMSFAGMPDFITSSDPEKAVNFWLVARLIGAISLLAIALIPWHITFKNKYFIIGIINILLITTLVFWVIIFNPQVLPRTYTEYGMTTIKTNIEYILSIMYLSACALFFIKMRQPRQFNVSYFFISAFSLAIAEMFFSVYAEISDLYNLSGHVYKLIGFIFLYKGAYNELVQRPYRLLAQSSSQLKATLDALPDLMIEMDGKGTYLKVHSTEPGDLAKDISQLLGKKSIDVLPKDQDEILKSALIQAKKEGISRNKVIEIPTVSGDIQHFELSVSYIPTMGADPERYIIISHNISQRIVEAKELHKLSQAIWQNPVAIFMLDTEQKITYVNKAFTDLTGYTLTEVLGKHPRLLYDGEDSQTFEKLINNELKKRKEWTGEINCISKDGRRYIAMAFVFPITDHLGNITGYFSTERDITEIKATEYKLQKITNFDPLTGLPNRKQLQKLLDYFVEQNKSLVVLWADLDHFRNINDVMGHSAGDIILIEVAKRIMSIARPQDVLSRLSGDDFILVLPDADLELAQQKAQKIIDLIKQPFYVEDQLISCACSVGISIFPDDGLDGVSLLQNAETAMHQVKEEVRGSYKIYKKQMYSETSRRLQLDIGLKQAIQNNELFIEYQPQVSIDTDEIIGAEALLRWKTANEELISPFEFIPIAETNGTIIQIGEWVLYQALEMLVEVINKVNYQFVMAVNISARQFEHPNFINLIKRALSETGAPAQCLQLEITEAVAMKNPELVAKKIQKLQSENIKIAIDDFGTGYSSLSYLKKFKVDTIKIDRSFINDIQSSNDENILADAIVYIAKILNVDTVAEGVETSKQLNYMQKLGCNAVQGYLFSKPLPSKIFLDFIQNNNINASRDQYEN